MDNFGIFLDAFELANTQLPDKNSLSEDDMSDHPHSKNIILKNKYFSQVMYHSRLGWEGFIFEVKSPDFEDKFNDYLNTIGSDANLNLLNLIEDFELIVDNFIEIYISKNQPKNIDICYKV